VRGRISIEDVKNYAKNLHQGATTTTTTTTTANSINETLPDFSKWGEISIEPMSAIRKKTAEHLSFAWSSIPTVTQFDKADITQLEKLRSVTITSYLIKVLGVGLKQFPKFNASIDMEKNIIISKKFYNVGVAVDTDRGLLVPVLKGIDQKTWQESNCKLFQGQRAKTFDGGDARGMYHRFQFRQCWWNLFYPIATPQRWRSWVCRSEMQNVYVASEGKFVARLMLPLSLSYDHRVIDGVEGIRFLRWIISALENPLLLL
jgi:pyruvate dehydrogenase E2 component (dihydrolipoamide acetyltransferase)